MDTLELVWETITKDKDGFPISKSQKYEAYCREKSVKRQEAYESMRAGVKVEAVFEIRQEDCEQTRHTVNGKTEYARKVEHDGRVYEIKRTYKTGKAKMEVICG